MPTTTNYGWTTPADTDLVKDGASAIRTLGTAIDTTVFNNASAAIAKTIVDAKGDLIVASGSDAVARLAVGTNDYVLTADSAATNGVKWAALPASGSLTLLSTTTLSGTSTSVTSISQSYKNLLIIVRALYLSSDDQAIRLTFEADGSNHNFGRFGTTGTAFNTGENTNGGYIEIGRGGTVQTAHSRFNAAINVIGYTSTDAKFVYGNSWARSAGANEYGQSVGATYTGATAVDEIALAAEGATLTGTMLIYGVN